MSRTRKYLSRPELIVGCKAQAVDAFKDFPRCTRYVCLARMFIRVLTAIRYCRLARMLRALTVVKCAVIYPTVYCLFEAVSTSLPRVDLSFHVIRFLAKFLPVTSRLVHVST